MLVRWVSTVRSDWSASTGWISGLLHLYPVHAPVGVPGHSFSPSLLFPWQACPWTAECPPKSSSCWTPWRGPSALLWRSSLWMILRSYWKVEFSDLVFRVFGYCGQQVWKQAAVHFMGVTPCCDRVKYWSPCECGATLTTSCTQAGRKLLTHSKVT